MMSRGLAKLAVLFSMSTVIVVLLCVSTRLLLVGDDCKEKLPAKYRLPGEAQQSLGKVFKHHLSKPQDFGKGLETINNDEFTDKYLSGGKVGEFAKKEVHQPRKKILVAVITTEKYLLTRARVIYKTWGRDVGPNNELHFFVGEYANTSHPDLKDLPIIKMKGLRDDVYPPMEKVFGILEYFHTQYGTQFRWFVRADDDVYIRIAELEAMLDKLEWTDRLYLGLPGYGVESYRKVLKLLPEESYCMGGPSITLSATGLKALYPYLRKCLNAALSYNQKVPKDDGWYYDDVELGRCASRTLGMKCSRGIEVLSISSTAIVGLAVQCRRSTTGIAFRIRDYGHSSCP